METIGFNAGHPLRDPKLIEKKPHPLSFWILFTPISEGSKMKKMKHFPVIIILSWHYLVCLITYTICKKREDGKEILSLCSHEQSAATCLIQLGWTYFFGWKLSALHRPKRGGAHYYHPIFGLHFSPKTGFFNVVYVCSIEWKILIAVHGRPAKNFRERGQIFF